jgi:RNA polymerase I-specific transcription initiation factor RRN5
MDTDSEHDDSDESRPSGDPYGDQVGPESPDISQAQQRREKLSTSPHKVQTQAPNFSEQKWMHLQKCYHDDYAELLREERIEGMTDGVPPINLEQSQIGAVGWSPSEKEALYQALSRKGTRNLPQLASAVGSKSQPEIQDFLLLLREKESERHLLHRQTKTIAHADIPAATEVNPDLEEALEKAADAQLAYEDHYEYVSGTQKTLGLWVIDREVAEQLDAEQDEALEALENRDQEAGESTFETPIFYISKFVELSERFFMNYGGSSMHENWRDIAMEEETPAVTREVISDLYDLAVHFTRKLLQTSIFLAQSRQRATTSSHYRHRSMIREQDVAAAVDILNLRCDLWQFWVGVPRRNKLAIVDDKHVKGGLSKLRHMSYDVVEQALSKRKVRWRGRRRSSAGTDSSLNEDEVFNTADQVGQDSGNDSVSSISQQSSSSEDNSPGVPEAHPLDAILDASSSSEQRDESTQQLSSTGSSTGGSSDDSSGAGFYTAASRRRNTHRDLEEEQDEYLEQLDAKKSREEEVRLWEVLGREKPSSIKAEIDKDSEIGVRPKVKRKSMDELTDSLADTKYGAEWELFGAIVPNDSFIETARARKRPRMIARKAVATPKPRKAHLPFRTRSPSSDTGESFETEPAGEV